MGRIIVGFPADNARQSVSSLLEQNGFRVSASCRTGAETIRTVKQMDGGIVICGWKFNDMMVDELAEALESVKVQILVIAKPAQLNMCEYKDLFRLHAPINSVQLITIVDMLDQIDSRNVRAAKKRTSGDKEIINKAKERIMEQLLMEEPDAHRFLQKRSMDTGKSLLEVAKEMLDYDYGTRIR